MTGFADTVLLGGKFFDPTSATSIEGGVAIRNGRILRVGPPEQIESLIGSATKVVATDNQLVIPGFQDAHVHPILSGIELLQCDLSMTTSAEECEQAIAAYAKQHKELDWIVGSGWSSDFFPYGVAPLDMIDSLIPDKPAALWNRDHHGIWVNSAALQAAGVTRYSADPEDGRIGRNAAGEPDGNLYEGAMNLIRAVQPPVTPELALSGLLEAQRVLHSYGVTSWQDAIIGYDLDPELSMGAYIEADQAGALTIRVSGCFWWERDRGLAQLREINMSRERMAREMSSERWRAAGVKIMVDGVLESHTAAVHKPYRDRCGHSTDNRGISFFDPDEMKADVAALDAAGYVVHFHALGDRAVTDALDAVEFARAQNPQGNIPHHLAHLQMITEEDVPRFKALGAVANLQMLWAAHDAANDELTIPFVDPSYANRIYPFGELYRAGSMLAAGSDWPVSTPNPLAAIHVGVNRVADSDGSRPFGGSAQKIPLSAAITAYTSGTALVSGHAHETGRLLPGYLADLAVLDRDLFTIDPLEISQARVVRTFVGGELVWEA